MYIEDILDKLVGIHSIIGNRQAEFFNSIELKMLSSISSQLNRSYAITEKQATVVERMLKKYLPNISMFFAKDMTSDIISPSYRLGKRKIEDAKSVKIFTDASGIKKISVSFPYNEALVNKIKETRIEFKNKFTTPRKRGINWDPENKSWVFSLYEPFISWIHHTFSSEEFVFDEKFLEFFNAIMAIENNVEKYLPVLRFSDNKFFYSNSHKNIPQPTSTDLLEVLFESKKYGITVWDESIALALKDDGFNPLTKIFLENQTAVSTAESIDVNNDSIMFTDFFDILKLNGIAMIVIPGGDEYFNLTKSYEELKKMGFKDEEMSVLFRTENNNILNINEFIKEHHLNNPISTNIKIYFTSLKFPKPLIANKIKIGTIINLGVTNAHHTMRTFIKNHHNVLNYKLKK